MHSVAWTAHRSSVRSGKVKARSSQHRIPWQQIDHDGGSKLGEQLAEQPRILVAIIDARLRTATCVVSGV